MNTYETLKQIVQKLAELQKTAISEKEWNALDGIQKAMTEVNCAIENTKQGQQEAIDFLFNNR